MNVKNIKAKIIIAVLMVVLVAYGISATNAGNSATTLSYETAAQSGEETGLSIGESVKTTLGDETAVPPGEPYPIGEPYTVSFLAQQMQVSTASSNGLGVGGVSGHPGVLSLWRTDRNTGRLVPIVQPAPIQQAIFAMNDGTGKTILVLTRSYTDSTWDTNPEINQFTYRALMKITAINPNDGNIIWDNTVVTDTWTDEGLP